MPGQAEVPGDYDQRDFLRLIPNAYKTLLTYMKTNGISGKHEKGILDCFEKDYPVDGTSYMDVCIAIE